MTIEEFLTVARSAEPTIEESVLVWYLMHQVERAKVSCYFDAPMLDELQREANRRRCSLSKVTQLAWVIAREQIKRYLPPRASA